MTTASTEKAARSTKGSGLFAACAWHSLPLRDLLSEPVRQGYSPTSPKVPGTSWILGLGALGRGRLDPRCVKIAPTGDPRLEACRLWPGDILVSRANSRPRVGLVGTYRGEPEWCAFPDLMMRLRPDPELVTPDYLVAYLRGPAGRAYFERVARGTSGTMVKIKRAMLESLPIMLPPRPEQEKIVEALGAARDAIEAAHAVVDGERAMRAALLARLVQRGLGQESLSETPIGPLPASWRVKPLGELCELKSGGTPSRGKVEYWGGSVPWVKTGEVGYRRILRTEESITRAGLHSSSALLLPAGTLLLAMYGQGVTRGKVALLGIDAAVNQACLAILEGQALDNEFLALYLEGEYTRLRRLGPQGGRKNLSISRMRRFLVPVPPREEQERIVAAVQAQSMELRREEAVLKRYREIERGLAWDIFGAWAERVSQPAAG